MNNYMMFMDFVGDVLDNIDPNDRDVCRFLKMVFNDMSPQQLSNVLATLVQSGYEEGKWSPGSIDLVVEQIEKHFFSRLIPKNIVVRTSQLSFLFFTSEGYIKKQAGAHDLPFYRLPNSLHRRFELRTACQWAKKKGIPIDLVYLDKLIQGIA